MTCFRSYSMWL